MITALEGIRKIASDAEIIYSNSGRIRSKLSNETTNTTDPALQKKILSEGGGISDYTIADAVSKSKTCDLTVVVMGGYGIRSDWGIYLLSSR